MPAAVPRLYFQTLFQHEVFRIISTLNAGSICLRHVNHGNTNTRFFFLIFWTKRHKIVEILTLLTIGSPILGVERFKFGPMLKLALFPLTLSRAASAIHIVYNSNNNIRLATIYWITNIPLEQKTKYSAFRSKT